MNEMTYTYDHWVWPDPLFWFHNWMTGLVAGAFAFLVYFIPAFNAYMRHHRNRSAIAMLNFLIGWTFIGWAVALVWSMTANVEGRPPRASAKVDDDIIDNPPQ